MSNDKWINLDDVYRHFREEFGSNLTREEMLRLYEAKWTEEELEEMSNRRKIKGSRATHSAIDEVDLTQLGSRERISRIQNSFAGRYNAYICGKCGKAYLTLDVDHGVTPMFGPCFATEGCGGQAHSLGYPEGDPPSYLGDAIIHWVKPTAGEYEKLSPSQKSHVKQGGLIRKATEATPDWVREML
jgi:hypothetical protein